MILAYSDESGDSGDINHGGSLTYTVGCVLVNSDTWPSAFNALLNFRRQLRTDYGISVRAELKANYLISGSGPLRKIRLTPGQRQAIYRAHLRQLALLDMRAFAVVVDKRSPELRDPVDRLAWQTIMERLERTSNGERVAFSLFHDNGNNLLVRSVARKARRRITAGSAYGPGQITLAAQRFVDDPVPRDSAESYLVQLADLVAYAGFRTLIAPGRAVRQVAPSDLWLDLGPAIHAAVNRISGGVPGVVVRRK